MLWVKAFHIIFMVCWFAGVFYLPRLFVYHAETDDAISNERFKIMEHKLYYYISLPSAVLTTVFGLWLMIPKLSLYETLMWMHAKMILVAILWGYTLFCGHLVTLFKRDSNIHTHRWYRWFNETPSVILVAVVILVVVKP